MRVDSAEDIAAALFSAELTPNLPQGKVSLADVPQPAAANP
jgi:hypothetical protein